MDEIKWKLDTKTSNEDFEFQFMHKNGDGYAGVIVERISLPLNALKEMVLEHVKKEDPKVKLISEEKRLG